MFCIVFQDVTLVNYFQLNVLCHCLDKENASQISSSKVPFYGKSDWFLSFGRLFHINWNIIPCQLEHRYILSGTTFHIIDNTPKDVEAMHKYIINEGGKMSDE